MAESSQGFGKTRKEEHKEEEFPRIRKDEERGGKRSTRKKSFRGFGLTRKEEHKNSDGKN
jgi:hypothetical protein